LEEKREILRDASLRGSEAFEAFNWGSSPCRAANILTLNFSICLLWYNFDI
jgi:hypothetical protein